LSYDELRLKDCKKFITEVSIPLSEWSAAYEMCLSSTVKYCEIVESDTPLSVYVSSKHYKSTKSQFSDLVKRYRSSRKTLSWKSFDVFSNFTTNLRIVSLNKTAWQSSFCNCSKFQKLSFCKHVLFVAVVYKLANVPPEAKNILLSNKSARGVRSKATPALEQI
jgi:hypothetical protein